MKWEKIRIAALSYKNNIIKNYNLISMVCFFKNLNFLKNLTLTKKLNI